MTALSLRTGMLPFFLVLIFSSLSACSTTRSERIQFLTEGVHKITTYDVAGKFGPPHGERNFGDRGKVWVYQYVDTSPNALQAMGSALIGAGQGFQGSTYNPPPVSMERDCVQYIMAFDRNDILRNWRRSTDC